MFLAEPWRRITASRFWANWETLKRREKGQRSTADAIEAVPHTLPALWRAEKIQSKTAKAGFNWDTISGALDKLEEEVRELRQAVENSQDPSAPHGIREEAGDVLFIVSRLRSSPGVDPEDALHRACDKFDARFRLVEEAADKPLDRMYGGGTGQAVESAKRSCLNTHPRLRNKLRTISCRRI